jgi:hypothetical protein
VAAFYDNGMTASEDTFETTNNSSSPETHADKNANVTEHSPSARNDTKAPSTEITESLKLLKISDANNKLPKQKVDESVSQSTIPPTGRQSPERAAFKAHSAMQFNTNQAENDRTAELERVLEERDHHNAKLEKKLAHLNKRLAEKDEKLNAVEAELALRNDDCDEFIMMTDRMEAEMLHRLDDIEDLKTHVAELNDLTADLEGQLHEKNKRYDKLVKRRRIQELQIVDKRNDIKSRRNSKTETAKKPVQIKQPYEKLSNFAKLNYDVSLPCEKKIANAKKMLSLFQQNSAVHQKMMQAQLKEPTTTPVAPQQPYEEQTVETYLSANTPTPPGILKKRLTDGNLSTYGSRSRQNSSVNFDPESVPEQIPYETFTQHDTQHTHVDETPDKVVYGKYTAEPLLNTPSIQVQTFESVAVLTPTTFNETQNQAPAQLVNTNAPSYAETAVEQTPKFAVVY